jgi:ribonuclease HI
VANVDIWKPLIELVQARNPTFRWVKGHSGDPMNDIVDALAVAASAGPFAPEPPAAAAAAAARTVEDPRLF